jgi:hypothetical protein
MNIVHGLVAVISSLLFSLPRLCSTRIEGTTFGIDFMSIGTFLAPALFLPKKLPDGPIILSQSHSRSCRAHFKVSKRQEDVFRVSSRMLPFEQCTVLLVDGFFKRSTYGKGAYHDHYHHQHIPSSLYNHRLGIHLDPLACRMRSKESHIYLCLHSR